MLVSMKDMLQHALRDGYAVAVSSTLIIWNGSAPY